MKHQIRILGIDDAPFEKKKGKKAIIIGTIFRGNAFLDGLLSTKVNVDGNNATKNIAGMIVKSKFYQQIRYILLDGIAVAGFNIIDIQKLNKETRIPVIVVMRHLPDLKKMKKALIKANLAKKYSLLEKAGKIYKHEKIFFQVAGTSPEDAEKILRLTSTHSLIPEPIRLAHIIGSGIILGQSTANA